MITSPEALEAREARPSGACPDEEHLARALGSVGGGNHFAEIVRIDRLIDPERARAHIARWMRDAEDLLNV